MKASSPLETTSSSVTTQRPQSSPAGAATLRPSSRTGGVSEPSRQRNTSASRARLQPSIVKKQAAATLPPTYDYRQGLRTDILKRIDNIPVVQLYPGQKIGGAVNSQSRWASLGVDPANLVVSGVPTSEGRTAPKGLSDNPERRKAFGRLVNSCTRNQKGTRSLFHKMLEEDGRIGESMGNLHERIRIMQSMPDLSMPEDEFENFVANAIRQQRALDAEMQEQLNAGFEAKGKKKNERGQTLGSIRHIFPLRDAKTGRVARGENFTRWRYTYNRN